MRAIGRGARHELRADRGDNAAWRQAVDALRAKTGIPLTFVDASKDGEHEAEDTKFSELYARADGRGVVLVRPDGFVARRFHGDAARGGSRFLDETFASILGELGPDAGNATQLRVLIAVQA